MNIVSRWECTDQFLQEYQTRIERNDNVVAMINEMRQALQVTYDLEDTRFERQREKQMEACRELVI